MEITGGGQLHVRQRHYRLEPCPASGEQSDDVMADLLCGLCPGPVSCFEPLDVTANGEAFVVMLSGLSEAALDAIEIWVEEWRHFETNTRLVVIDAGEYGRLSVETRAVEEIT